MFPISYIIRVIQYQITLALSAEEIQQQKFTKRVCTACQKDGRGGGGDGTRMRNRRPDTWSQGISHTMPDSIKMSVKSLTSVEKSYLEKYENDSLVRDMARNARQTQ
jgi:hypothetical protein